MQGERQSRAAASLINNFLPFFPEQNRSAFAFILSWKLAPIQSEVSRSPITLLTSAACWGRENGVDHTWSLCFGRK